MVDKLFNIKNCFDEGFESLEELNQVMTDIEATQLTEDSNFKTRYFQMMLSWLMETKGLGSTNFYRF